MNKNHGTSTTTAIKNESFEDRIDSLKDSVRGLADIGTERATEIKDKAFEVKDNAVNTAETYLAKVKAMIVANPLASVGIAFGVGYVAMRIVRR